MTKMYEATYRTMEAEMEDIERFELTACHNCKFFLSLEGGNGECRRRPPVVDMQTVNYTGRFPAARFNWWCGEFEGLQ